MGIEPTGDDSRRRPTGFEDQARHQTRSASNAAHRLSLSKYTTPLFSGRAILRLWGLPPQPSIFPLVESPSPSLYFTLRMKIIANPKAGHGRAAKNLAKLHTLLKYHEIDYELVETQYPGHATKLARQLADSGTPQVVVMGGDGTIGEVIDGIVQSETGLGVISVGTGNDLARSLGLPYNNLERSLAVVLSGMPRAIDVGWERDRHFISCLGLGFPAVVASESNKMKWLKGPAAFFAAVYKALYRMQSIPMRLTLDEETFDLKCTSVLVQNTPYTGGGLHMAPQAKVDDGYFDVVVVQGIGKLDLMLNFPKVYTGSHLKHPAFSVYRTRSVKIDSPVSLEKMFDGDICGTPPVDARVLPQRVKITVPLK